MVGSCELLTGSFRPASGAIPAGISTPALVWKSESSNAKTAASIWTEIRTPRKTFFNLRKQLRADSPDVKDMESVSVASRLRPRRAMLVEVSTNLALQMSSIFVFKESPRLQAGEDVN